MKKEEKIVSYLLKLFRNVFGHLRNIHCQTFMYVDQCFQIL